MNVIEDHLTMFDTVLNSEYFRYHSLSSLTPSDAAGSDVLGNDSLLNYVFNAEGGLQCPLLLVDRYDTNRLRSSLSRDEAFTWICPNVSCKHVNRTNAERCSYCLTYRTFSNLHVVFLLHGFRVMICIISYI